MEETTAKNSVELTKDGYILVKLVGKQDYMTMEQVGRDCAKLAQELTAKHIPVTGLVDFTEDKSFDAGTNRAAFQALEQIEYAKVALFGKDAILTEVTRALVAALGKGETTKVFTARDEAVAWLMMKDPLGA